MTYYFQSSLRTSAYAIVESMSTRPSGEEWRIDPTAVIAEVEHMRELTSKLKGGEYRSGNRDVEREKEERKSSVNDEALLS